jgi:hypothetical protein
MAKKSVAPQDHSARKDEATQQLLHIEADLIFFLHKLGDSIAKKKGYKDLDGLDAIRYFLIQKHNWTPSQVKSMNYEDLQLAMSQDA